MGYGVLGPLRNAPEELRNPLEPSTVARSWPRSSDRTYEVEFTGAVQRNEELVSSDYGRAPEGMKRQRAVLQKFIDRLR